MRRGAGRAGRIVALSVATAACAAVLLVLRVPASTGAPTQDCTSTTASTICTTEPELTATTTIDEETTTSTEAETSTTEIATTTTRQATSSTRSEATSTTPDTTRSSDVLISGDGTEGAELTTTTEVMATRISSDGPSDGALIALVIVGLVLIAGVVAVLTWRYWVATRPPLADRETRSSDAG